MSCEEGTAVVFDNTQIVHRVRMIKNKMNDKKTRYRSFIRETYPNLKQEYYMYLVYDQIKILRYVAINNLIIFQIKYPIYSLSKYIYCYHIYLFCITLLNFSGKKSLELCKLICEFGNCGLTESDAIELRKLGIELRQNSKGVFSAEHWG